MSDYFTDSAADKLTRCRTIAAALKSDRTTFDPHWRELGEFIAPTRTRFYTGGRNQGGKKNQEIMDGTAGFSTRTLQSGLHAGLTSPARPWMKLTTPNPDLAKLPKVKAWLSTVTQLMLMVFQQTNLYTALPTLYGDMGVFGTAAMGMMEDSKDLFRCYPYPLGSYAIGLDKRGLATSFMREFRLSVRQVVEDYGLQADRKTIDWSKLSTRVKTCWEKAQYEEPIDLIWLVLPNPHADPTKLAARFKPWASCHWEAASAEGKFLRESGYNTFPILAPRWDVTGEDSYGTESPGMMALGDVKQLMKQQRAKALAIQTIIKPPTIAPTSLRTGAVNLLPGGVTWVDVPAGMAGLRSAYEVRIDISHLLADITETQQRIQRAFFEDLFLMLARADASAQPITAEEVRERHEEKLLALGPVLERTADELLEPLVDRAYQMMFAARLLPDIPDELHGVNVKAEYTSILASAQKLVGLVGLDRLLQTTTPLIQSVAPAMRHKLDYNKIVDVLADTLGLSDPSIVRTTEDADKLAQAEAQQAQRAAEADQAQKMAAAMKHAGSTPMDGDTVLSRMVAGQGAEAPAA